MRKPALFGLVLFGIALAPAVYGLARAGRGRRVIAWWQRRAAALLGLDIHVAGAPCTGAALWCANHVSWLDVVVLGGLADAAFVSKAEVGRWPLLGWCAIAAGTIFLKRGAGQSGAALVTMEHRLRRGRNVAIFPEGTTSPGDAVRRFHPRLFGAAVACGAPVQPVMLRYLEGGKVSPRAPFVGEQTFLPHLLRLLDGGTIHAEVRFLPTIAPAGHDRRSLARAAHGAVAAELAAAAAHGRTYTAAAATAL